jgi:predicted pyridoxine 5'-phosphate oxidase superfamily flavin-nucleotide-binding protein
MQVGVRISQGQQEARTRWGTHENGEAFDRKKRSFLTEEAYEFIAQQVMCVLVGPDPKWGPCGLLISGQPGFVEVPDERTCLIPIPRQYEESSVIQGLRKALLEGLRPRIALCFVQHTTRRRLCVQGEAEISSVLSTEILRLRLRVGLAFFHCPKYIRTRVPGLHVPSEKSWPVGEGQPEDRLTEITQAFLARQLLCYLCTIDHAGQCAVNHRGGPPGFLVTLAPDRLTPGGVILLPDYAGNGAFEAIGNILETRRAALLVPGYADGLALCLSGEATVLEPAQLPRLLREKCRGAQRIVALAVQRIERQDGDWSETLAYEQARGKIFEEAKQAAQSCQR